MIGLETLRDCVRNGIDFVKKQKDVIDAEIFASWNEHITVRLNYTSDIPCNGVHEPNQRSSAALACLSFLRQEKR